eukprot:6207758-Pleurochrysis_carterae.AAC.4
MAADGPACHRLAVDKFSVSSVLSFYGMPLHFEMEFGNCARTSLESHGRARCLFSVRASFYKAPR